MPAEPKERSKGGRQQSSWSSGPRVWLLQPSCFTQCSQAQATASSALPAAGTPARGWGHSGQHLTVAARESEPKPPLENQGHGSCSQQNQFKHEQLIGKELSFIPGTREKFPPGSPDCALFSLARAYPALPNRIPVRTSNSTLAIPGDTFPKEHGCHSFSTQEESSRLFIAYQLPHETLMPSSATWGPCKDNRLPGLIPSHVSIHQIARKTRLSSTTALVFI